MLHETAAAREAVPVQVFGCRDDGLLDCAGQNVAKLGHFTTVARLICRTAFRGIGVHQFFASKNTHGRFQPNRLGLFVSPILSFRQSGDVPRRIGDWPASHLDAFDLEVHAAIPTGGLLIAVTLPPAVAVHRLATVSRLLPPRSGLSRSDLVLWP
jgi:hypothetical protein